MSRRRKGLLRRPSVKWNDGTGQEIFTMEELIAKFSMDRVHKGGAKFDYEKAKWYNGEWIKKIALIEMEIIERTGLTALQLSIQNIEGEGVALGRPPLFRGYERKSPPTIFNRS